MISVKNRASGGGDSCTQDTPNCAASKNFTATLKQSLLTVVTDFKHSNQKHKYCLRSLNTRSSAVWFKRSIVWHIDHVRHYASILCTKDIG